MLGAWPQRIAHRLASTMLLGLHVVASKHRDDLLEEVRRLRAAGKIREAKRAFKAAETIQKQLFALEKEFRPASPADE